MDPLPVLSSFLGSDEEDERDDEDNETLQDLIEKAEIKPSPAV